MATGTTMKCCIFCNCPPHDYTNNHLCQCVCKMQIDNRQYQEQPAKLPNSPLSLSERMIALEIRYNELLNKVGECSMNYHKMESSLREFEKQKVDPVYDSIAQIRQEIAGLKNRVIILEVMVVPKTLTTSNISCENEDCKNDKFKVRLTSNEVLLLCSCGLVNRFIR